MLDILPALLWIIAAVIAVNICSITAIRGNLFSKKHRDVHPVRWSIIALHFTSLARCHIRYMRCSGRISRRSSGVSTNMSDGRRLR